MTSIDPNAVLFPSLVSSSAGERAEKIAPEDGGSSQEHFPDFERLLAKMSQAQPSQKVDETFTNVFNHLFFDGGMTNTTSPHDNSSTQDVTTLHKVQAKPVTVAQNPSSHNTSTLTSILVSDPQNSLPVIHRNSTFSLTSEETSTKDISRLDSDSGRPKTNSISDILILNLAALSASPISSTVAPKTLVPNGLSDQNTSKSNLRPAQADPNPSAFSEEPGALIVSPAFSKAFLVQEPELNFKVLDIQSHLAPVEQLSQWQLLEVAAISKHTSGSHDQTGAVSMNNTGSIETHLDQKSAAISQTYSLIGSTATTPSAVPALRLTTVVSPITASLATSQLLAFDSTPEPSSLQPYKSDSSAQIPASQGAIEEHRVNNVNATPSKISNLITPSLVFNNNLFSQGSFVRDPAFQNNQLQADLKLNSLQTRTRLDKSDERVILAQSNLATEGSHLPAASIAKPPTKGEWELTGLNQIAFKQEVVQTYSEKESGLLHRRIAVPISAPLSSTVEHETETQLDSSFEPARANANIVAAQDSGGLSQVQLSSISESPIFMTNATQLAASEKPLPPLLNSFTAPPSTISEVSPFRQSNPIVSGSLVKKENFSTSRHTENVVGNIPMSSLSLPFSAHAEQRVLSTSPSPSTAGNILYSDVVLAPLLVRGSPKTGSLEPPTFFTRDQKGEIGGDRIVAEHLLRSVSNNTSSSGSIATNRTSSASDTQTKNTDMPIVQRSEFISAPEVAADQEISSGSDYLLDQNKASLFPDNGTGSTFNNEHFLDAVTSKAVSKFQSNVATLTIGISPVDQITSLIAQEGANASIGSSSSSSIAGQRTGLVFSSGVKTLSLALEPQDLGSVNVKLRLSKNGLEMHVEADRLATSQSIEKDKDRLIKGLQDSGYTVDSIVIKTADHLQANLQQEFLGDFGKSAIETNQQGSQATGLNYQQGNSNANGGSGSENSNRPTKLGQFESGAGDVPHSAGNGDIYI